MALRKTVSLQGVATLNIGGAVTPLGDQSLDMDAYIKVETVRGSKESLSALVSLSNDATAIQQTYRFEPDLDGPNFIKQVYEHLKTLPEFAGAEDC